jgi:hypothetical protein
LNAIKAMLGLCTENSNCFLSHASAAVAGVNGVDVLERTAANALETSTFVADSTAPQLKTNGFLEMNLNNGTITLLFNEPVNGSTLDPTAITLLSFFKGSSVISYRLSGGSLHSQPSAESVRILLSSTDLNEIKARETLCLNSGTCYLNATASLIRDNSNQAVQSTAATIGTFAQEFIDDVTRPSLESFSLNINNSMLILTFSETVSVNTPALDVTKITIQANASTTVANERFTLTTSSTSVSPNGRVITIDLSSADLKALKAGEFATEVNDTYILLAAGVLSDTAQVPNVTNPLTKGLASRQPWLLQMTLRHSCQLSVLIWI